jgi:hypothetical protein
MMRRPPLASQHTGSNYSEAVGVHHLHWLFAPPLTVMQPQGVGLVPPYTIIPLMQVVALAVSGASTVMSDAPKRARVELKSSNRTHPPTNFKPPFGVNFIKLGQFCRTATPCQAKNAKKSEKIGRNGRESGGGSKQESRHEICLKKFPVEPILTFRLSRPPRVLCGVSPSSSRR